MKKDEFEYEEVESKIETDVPRGKSLRESLEDFLEAMGRVGGRNIRSLTLHFQAETGRDPVTGKTNFQGQTWINGSSDMIKMMGNTLNREFKDCLERIEAEQEQDQPKH